MSNTISNMTLALGAAATANIIPAAGQAYEINMIGSDQVFVLGVPDVEVGMRKVAGALTAIMLIDASTDTGNRNRMHKWLITPAVHLTVKNNAAGAANISWIGKRINPDNVLSDVVALGIGAHAHINPGVTYNMAVYELGSSLFHAGEINPDIKVTTDDATGNEAIIWDQHNIWGHDKQLNIPLSATMGLVVLNGNAGGLNFAYSAEKVRNAVAVSGDVATGADLDVIPPDGQEWEITCIAAELLLAAGIGVAPDQKPDITVSLVCNAALNLSNLMEAGSVPAVVETLMWEQPISIRIDHTHFLRINNVNGADNMVSVLGYRVA
jgi:hypothetical protein